MLFRGDAHIVPTPLAVILQEHFGERADFARERPIPQGLSHEPQGEGVILAGQSLTQVEEPLQVEGALADPQQCMPAVLDPGHERDRLAVVSKVDH